MSVLRLTTESDLYRPDGAATFERVSGATQTSQHLRTRLRLFDGEVFRDTRIGVQYFSIVMRPGIGQQTVANHIASVALGTPGVIDCALSYSMEPVRGVVTIDATATYSAIDLATRQPTHEQLQIQVGGSIT